MSPDSPGPPPDLRDDGHAARRGIVLVDGEHQPRVVGDAIARLTEAGHRIEAAVFMGGGEKLAGPPDAAGLPIVTAASPVEALRAALERFSPDVVLDLCDAPVVGTRLRFRLACEALARGASYRGAGFALAAPPRPRLSAAPAIAVAGTGKRTGKTAVSAYLARRLASRGIPTVVVAMGRGGPPRPVVVRGDRARPDAAELLSIADRGEHAASDSYEDAVVGGVATVGAWRAGAGPAGTPFVDTVAAAVAEANRLDPEAIVLEGSGTAIPPVHADATILVVGGATPPEEIADGLGPYRLLLADLVVVTMSEEPVLSAETSLALGTTLLQLARDVRVVRTVFRPAPVESVAGKKIFFATTAPESVGEALRVHLEVEEGAHVVGISHRLADRPALLEEVRRAEGTYEIMLTELKAAAVDVAARAALEAGAGVVFCDNVPRAVEGDLDGALDEVSALAKDRFMATEVSA